MIVEVQGSNILSLNRPQEDPPHVFVYRLHPEDNMTDVRHADEKKLSERLHAALHDILSSSEPQGILKIYSGKTYLDMSCLPAPDEQETTGSRARYLWSCSVFVPVISWGKGGSVLEQLGRINEEHDYVSDFLVHALTALYLLNKDAGRLKAVLPILRDESGGKTSMSSAFDRLSHKASMSSCERASEVLLEVGVRREKEAILQYLLGVSVRDAVAMLLPAVRGAQGVQEEERGRRSKGVYGMYVAAENDVERSAVEAGELIVACLSKIVREHVDRKLWEFSNHNPRGIEVLQVLRESGLHDRFFEFFALRGIETIHKVSKHTKTSFMHRRCGAVTRSCDEVLAALQHHDESSVRTLEKLVEDYREDERFLPLNERLRRYRDSDVHGVLALRTSNSLETALVKLPARSCVVFLSLVYLVFGVKQLGLLGTDQLWLPHTNSSTPVSPRVVRISTVADPIISFTWSFLFLSGIVLSLFSTPLQGKRLLLATGHLVIAGNVMCVVADALQCSREGTGIGSVCNSNMKVVAIVLLMLIMYLAHFVQHYFWLSAFFMQGAYCLLVSASVSHVAELSIFLLLGLGCWAVGLLIVVKYHLAYRKTFRELKVAMLGFEETWRGVMREKARAVEEISVLARAIAEELEEKVREDTKTWGRLLCVTLGLKERRYSRRNGKIRQASRDFEQLFLQAQEVSAAFQLWVSGWNRVGRVEHGNVKSCARAMQKTVRSYRRDPSCLTDLVRCTIVVQSVEEVQEWLSSLRSRAVIGVGVGPWDKPRGGRVAAEDVELGLRDVGGEVYMSITNIKNRYDPLGDTSLSGGYRDLCLCVEVGWTMEESSQCCTFVPVKEWERTLGLRKHICEIQVLLEEMHSVKKLLHKEYVNFRNTLCQ